MSSLREQLEEVRVRNGALTPRVVVEEARPEDSPLHNRFEWDDAIAAESWRLDQARELIRSVRLNYTDSEGAAREVRAYVSISRGDTPEREYLPTDEVVTDPVLRAIALRDMERQWRELFAKFQDFEEFILLVQGDLAKK